MSRKEPDTACAVCGRLMIYVEIGGRFAGWRHDSESDHVAIPVEASQVRIPTECDFCSQAAPRLWVLTTREFVAQEHPTGQHISEEGQWAACEACWPFVRRRDWIGLMRHLRKAAAFKVTKEAERNIFRVWYRLEKAILDIEPYMVEVPENQPT